MLWIKDTVVSPPEVSRLIKQQDAWHAVVSQVEILLPVGFVGSGSQHVSPFANRRSAAHPRSDHAPKNPGDALQQGGYVIRRVWIRAEVGDEMILPRTGSLAAFPARADNQKCDLARRGVREHQRYVVQCPPVQPWRLTAAGC